MAAKKLSASVEAQTLVVNINHFPFVLYQHVSLVFLYG